eukprot:gene742-313_t
MEEGDIEMTIQFKKNIKPLATVDPSSIDKGRQTAQERDRELAKVERLTQAQQTLNGIKPPNTQTMYTTTMKSIERRESGIEEEQGSFLRKSQSSKQLRSPLARSLKGSSSTTALPRCLSPTGSPTAKSPTAARKAWQEESVSPERSLYNEDGQVKLVPDPKPTILSDENVAGTLALSARLSHADREDTHVTNSPGRKPRDDLPFTAEGRPEKQDESELRPQLDLWPATLIGMVNKTDQKDISDLERFDRADKFDDFKPEEWVAFAKEEPDTVHAECKVFKEATAMNPEGFEMEAVWVRAYDRQTKKFTVETQKGNVKHVSRLSLRFVDENPQKWMRRIECATALQASTENMQKFMDAIAAIPNDDHTICPMVDQLPAFNLATEPSKKVVWLPQRMKFWAEACKDLEEPLDSFKDTTKQLLLDIESGYILAMKFDIYKQKHIQHNGFQDSTLPAGDQECEEGRAQALASSILWCCLPKPIPVFGLAARVTTPKDGRVVNKIEDFECGELLSGDTLKILTRVVHRYYHIEPLRLLDINRGEVARTADTSMGHLAVVQKLKNPKIKESDYEALDIEEYSDRMAVHRDLVLRIIMNEWRGYIISDVMDTLSDKYSFFGESRDAHLKSFLHQLLRRIDLILAQQTDNFAKASIVTWVKFLSSFAPSSRKCRPNPLLKISLGTNDNGETVFNPSCEDIKTKLEALTISIAQTIREVKITEKDLVPCYSTEALQTDFAQSRTSDEPLKDPELLCDMQDDDESIKQSVKCIGDVLKCCFEEPNKLLEQYRKFEYLLHMEPPDVDPYDHEDIIEQCRALFTARDEVQRLSCSIEKYHLVEVHFGAQAERLVEAATTLMNGILEQLAKSIYQRTADLCDSWRVCAAKLRKTVEDEVELADIKRYVQDINKLIDANVREQRDIKKKIETCDTFFYRLNVQVIEDHMRLLHWPQTVRLMIGDRVAEIEKEKLAFMERLASEKIVYEQDLIRWKQEIEMGRTSFTEELKQGAARVEDFRDRELLFNIEQTDPDAIEELIEANEPCHKLWSMIIQFQYDEEEWLTGGITKISGDDVADQVDTCWKTAYKMAKILVDGVDDIQKKVLQDFQESIKDFKQKLPVIEALCNQAITPLHWNRLFDAMNWEPDCELGDITLTMLVEHGVTQTEVMETLEEISVAAQKEHSLRKALEAMRVEWKPICFEQVVYKADVRKTLVALLVDKEGEIKELKVEKTKAAKAQIKEIEKEMHTIEDKIREFDDTCPYMLKGIDDVQTILDDHVVKVQAIRGSPFCKPFESECKAFEQRLNFLQESMDEALKTQRTWLYLEPIFASDDIKGQMPAEAEMFGWCDDLWREVMGKINETPECMEFIDFENILFSFQESNRKLDRIQKQLNDYLEVKRLVFPRFFFLSNDELLSILSETKDPTLVQPQLGQCFEGMTKVKFDKGNDNIEYLVDATGETVELLNKVNVTSPEVAGQVELWMLEIEASMRHAIKLNIDQSHREYPNEKRTEWVKKWPGMVIICVDMVFWTRETEAALDTMAPVADGGMNNHKAMDDYLAFLKAQMLGTVFLVRGDCSKALRKTLGAMTTIDVHNRDVIAMLCGLRTPNSKAFDWLAQLRYYWYQKGEGLDARTGEPYEDVACECRIVNSVLWYAFEYLGNSDRLVITPLTDRCYRTLMGAMHLYYGGAPEGPAGTGKTETVKDLAKAVAVMCVVFNCSDGLDFQAMGKFFKGLAASGGWCCFDEFNRINVEVLSVVAQQVLTIQMAIRAKVKRFNFEGTDLPIRPCSVNITMNPGYAGRSELPDNLKALFRPCAMMVPDYAMIGEIFLYAYGFQKAKDLGRKATRALGLSSEQLSKQGHYDFGMRGLKSLLVASGAMLRKYANDEALKEEFGDSFEDKLALKAFLDVNRPKFTTADVPLFDGIIADLFPGITEMKNDNSALESAICAATEEMGLTPTENHITKCVQLWETMLVRHGLMTVGLPPCGKTSVNDALSRTLEILREQENAKDVADQDPECLFMPVTKYKMNPKAMYQTQLYGCADENTQEWADGILAISVRAQYDAQRSEPDRRQWVIFDGPVDAIWIEDMNTVLDDSKKLCLVSGEIIKLAAFTNVMFEVADLAVASPATVSRVGIVFMEPHNLAWKPCFKAWLAGLDTKCSYLEPAILDEVKKICETLFYAHLDASLDALANWKLPIPSPQITIGLAGWLGISMCRLMDALILEHYGPEAPRAPNVKETGPRIESLFYFALTWTLGGVLDETSRGKFDEFLREIIVSPTEECREKYTIISKDWTPTPATRKEALPPAEGALVYDFMVNPESGKWQSWQQRIKQLNIPDNAEFHTIIVPNTDTVRNEYLMQILIHGSHHVLFSGVTGTGKTICVNNMLLNGFDKEKYSSAAFALSAATSHNVTQDVIDGKVDKRSKGVFGPPLGKKMIVFVDDINMPQIETYGAQGAIEILRQYMFQGGWYDRKTNDFRKLLDLLFIGAMGPPGAGKNIITARYTWHFNVMTVTPYEGEGLNRIFETIMKWFLGSRFNSAVAGQTKNLVAACLDVYKEAGANLLPTPSKSHYLFNLRDLGKVFQGICLCVKESLPGADDLIKCWAHEIQRVFQDRLVTAEDANWFKDEVLVKKMDEHFKKKWSSIVKLEPIIFCDFHQEKAPFFYQEVPDHVKLLGRCQERLDDYNAMSKTQMNLVLFTNFVEHVTRVVRVCKLPLGNALCVGVGGSGRKSVATLASSVLDVDILSIEIAKNYGVNEWHEDVARILMRAGIKSKPINFLFSDTQVAKESFLEDISNILNTGEVPNLYTMEDKATIQDECTKRAEADGAVSPAAIFAWYVGECRRNLHIVMCMSPIGAAFRNRLRNYPSLVNCCTIDWLKEWPKDALVKVGNDFLSKIEDIDDKTLNGLVKTCVEMQTNIYGTVEKFRQEMRRFFYITPTSYLELIDSFKRLLEKRRDEVMTAKSRYEIGLSKILSTEKAVGSMQKELIELQPVLKQMTEDNAKLMITIKENTQTANETKVKVAEEEKEATTKTAEANAVKTEWKSGKSLSKADIVEVKNFKTPPSGVILTAEGLCHMFEVPPQMDKNPSGMGPKIANYWEPSKKHLFSDTNLIKKMIEFDKDNIKPEVMEKVRPFGSNPDFEPDVVKKGSVAAAGICKWVRAMIVYDRVAKVVEPKRAALAIASAEAAEAEARLAAAQKTLKDIIDNLKMLQKNFDEATQKQEDLQEQVTDCKNKLHRAEKLLGGLGGEKGRWTINVEKLGVDYNNLTGDVLIASGFMAYLGVFTQAYRKESCASWVDLLQGCDIACASEFDLPAVVGDQIKIRQWIIDKLPNDAVSVDNAITMDNSKRWPLLIDPQLQGNKWIKNTYGEELKAIRLTQSDYARKLETAIQFGQPVLIENVLEVLDPMLDPLLQKQFYKAGNLLMIRLGDATIEYAKEFMLFITSKLPNPHYAPEICVTVTILNFVTTWEGLADGMLATLVAKENHDMEKKRVQLVVESAESKAALKEIEDKILRLLSEASGNILDDEVLIDTLTQSKVTSNAIEEKVKIQEKTQQQINATRAIYAPVADRSAALFFVVSDLGSVEPSYQYSLEWFVNIFLVSIDMAPQSPKKAD